MPKKNKNIFLVAGGTGGHLFPAVAVAQRDKTKNFIFVVDTRVEKILKKYKVKNFVVSSSKFNKNIFRLILAVFKILYGTFQSVLLLKKYRPKLVVGFGGYTSIPTILAAKIFNIQTLIHEQNAVMGKTNRLLSKISNKTAISFNSTKYAKKDAIFTGVPIRVFKKKKIKKDKKRVLVLGGSQGAKIFSQIIPKVLIGIKQEYLKNLMIVQQTRKEDKTILESTYNKLNVKCTVKEFFDDVQNEIYNSDIVIARCGASTLAEIEYCKKFSLLFPLPTAMDDHQLENAKQFKKKNDCQIYNQNNIPYSKLRELLKSQLFYKNEIKTNLQESKKISLIKFIDDIIQ
ncbi:MAG: UDP-N-acetylglucosamine--N-acetylmuramyl-(pentapeptide) pyrophosphoryl-undecaprenol N-acetylglucosamine transferase [Alphaproteobacteria bacterium]